MVTIVSNTVLEYGIVILYTRNRVYLRHSQNNSKNDNCEVMDVLINWIVVIISQCICISKHHVAYFKYIPQ